MLSIRSKATSILGSIKSFPTRVLSKSYASFHGGYHDLYAPQPTTKETDMSGKHVQVYKTTCTSPNCTVVNCADSTDPNVDCPNRTPSQNNASIPNSPEHTTAVVGNMTSKIPNGMKGGTVDASRNYVRQNKPQFAVADSADAADREVNPADVKLNQPATNLLQKNHSNVSSIFTK